MHKINNLVHKHTSLYSLKTMSTSGQIFTIIIYLKHNFNLEMFLAHYICYN